MLLEHGHPSCTCHWVGAWWLQKGIASTQGVGPIQSAALMVFLRLSCHIWFSLHLLPIQMKVCLAPFKLPATEHEASHSSGDARVKSAVHCQGFPTRAPDNPVQATKPVQWPRWHVTSKIRISSTLQCFSKEAPIRKPASSSGKAPGNYFRSPFSA